MMTPKELRILRSGKETDNHSHAVTQGKSSRIYIAIIPVVLDTQSGPKLTTKEWDTGPWTCDLVVVPMF